MIHYSHPNHQIQFLVRQHPGVRSTSHPSTSSRAPPVTHPPPHERHQSSASGDAKTAAKATQLSEGHAATFLEGGEGERGGGGTGIGGGEGGAGEGEVDGMWMGKWAEGTGGWKGFRNIHGDGQTQHVTSVDGAHHRRLSTALHDVTFAELQPLQAPPDMVSGHLI